MKLQLRRFDDDVKCSACGTMHTLKDAKARACKGSLWHWCFIGTLHLHYVCKICGCHWVTGPKPFMKRKPNKFCRTCNRTGMLEKGGEVVACPDCSEGKAQKQFLEQDYVPPVEEEKEEQSEEGKVVDWKNRTVPAGPFPEVPFSSSALPSEEKVRK